MRLRRLGTLAVLGLGVLFLAYFSNSRREKPDRADLPERASKAERRLSAQVVSLPPPGLAKTQSVPAVETALVVATNPAIVSQIADRLSDNSVPIEKRRKELAELSQHGDADAVKILMALGERQTLLNSAAIEALGNMKNGGVADYLKGRLADGDPRILAAAATSLGRQEGAAAVPVLADTLKANRRRPDGFQDLVCAACVKALADTRAQAAVPVLESELRETVGTTLHHEYGSQIVKALASIGGAEARRVLLAYADRLNGALAGQVDNPLGKRYIVKKIHETRAAAEAAGNEPKRQ